MADISLQELKQVALNQAFAAACAELPGELATRMAMLYFDGDTIYARRTLPDGSSAWVDVGALFGKKGSGSVDDGVERAMAALWPEADSGTKRMFRIVANVAAKAGGLF